jgi:predicted ATPase
MIQSITFAKELFCFKVGDSYDFKPLTLLVGDQGCGKSTILNLLGKQGMYGSTQMVNIEVGKNDNGFIHHDFEMASHRTNTSGPNPYSPDYNDQLIRMIDSKSMSHGEATKVSFEDFDRIETDILILDEPDMSLSMRSVHMLVEHVKRWIDSGKQVILSCHHPYLIEAFDEVLSLEHKQWMSSKEFIESHNLKMDL